MGGKRRKILPYIVVLALVCGILLGDWFFGGSTLGGNAKVSAKQSGASRQNSKLGYVYPGSVRYSAYGLLPSYSFGI